MGTGEGSDHSRRVDKLEVGTGTDLTAQDEWRNWNFALERNQTIQDEWSDWKLALERV